MSDQTPPNLQHSGSNATSGPSAQPKAIGSFAKKQSDVTRQGTQKLKFVPTIPARRKKEETPADSSTAPTSSTPAPTAPTRGRGRGRGRGADGRGGAPRPPTEMTASGPFAMGPALAGTSARRTVPRSNFTPIAPMGPSMKSSLGAGLSQTPAPSLKQEQGEPLPLSVKKEEDDEVYSDPDEGVEIVDMDDVRRMDWMAPETLLKDKHQTKKKKIKIATDGSVFPPEAKGKAKVQVMDVEEAAAVGEVDLANAVDLEESEEEEEMEDLIEDFAAQGDADQELDLQQERVFFFQFPEPFPSFVPPQPAHFDDSWADPTSAETNPPQKRVSFSEDTKPATPDPLGKENSTENDESANALVDGVIGQLEVYRSGKVKMRLNNGMLFDVSGATQPSFLQQVVHLDQEKGRINVIGEVNKRFVVSPDLDSLLSAMEISDHQRLVEPKMDIT